MGETRPTFPLFNRLVVLLLSSAILFGLISQLARPAFRGSLDLASGFLMVVFVGMACWGIWISLKWPAGRLELRDIAPTHERPFLPDNAIICQFFTGLRTGTVVIEPDAAVIHFDHCHVPNRFLAVAQRTFRCSLSEIKDFYCYQAGGASLTIRTATGRAIIPEHATNYDQLVEFLQRTIPARPIVLGADHPLMGYVYLVGALTGLFSGVYFTPRDASNSVLGVFVIVGAFLGILLSWLFVYLIHRYLKIEIARLIGYGVVGLIGGLTLALLIAPFLEWSPVPLVALATAGAILGVFWGSRSTRSS